MRKETYFEMVSRLNACNPLDLAKLPRELADCNKKVKTVTKKTATERMIAQLTPEQLKELQEKLGC